jgi:hypothetical protein
MNNLTRSGVFSSGGAEMLKSTKQKLGALAIAPFVGVFMVGSAAAAPETCNWKTARDLANAGDYAGLCDCAQVTPSFLERLQRRSDFETTLSVTGAQCPGLATLLTDLPTASVQVASNRGEDRSSNGPGNVGGGGPAGDGGPGGDDGPGDGGDGPGDGGGDGPGNGGDGPGNGGNGGNNGGPGNGNGNGGNPGNGGGNNGGSGPGTGNGGGNNGQGGGSGNGGGGNGNGGNSGGGKGGGTGGDGKGGGKNGGGKGKK